MAIKNRNYGSEDTKNKLDKLKKISNLNNEKAITLIALIVTIIVLLILVGVTINIIGNRGITKRAKDATDIWRRASTNESNDLDGVLKLIDSYDTNSINQADFDLVKKYFIGKGYPDVVDMNNSTPPKKIIFLDDVNSITDASTSLKFVKTSTKSDSNGYYGQMYAQYKNVVYVATTENLNNSSGSQKFETVEVYGVIADTSNLSDYDLVKKYFIGRSTVDVFDMEKSTENTRIFLDDVNSITDASTSLKFVKETQGDNSYYDFVQYKNVVYKATDTFNKNDDEYTSVEVYGVIEDTSKLSDYDLVKKYFIGKTPSEVLDTNGGGGSTKMLSTMNVKSKITPLIYSKSNAPKISKNLNLELKDSEDNIEKDFIIKTISSVSFRYTFIDDPLSITDASTSLEYVVSDRVDTESSAEESYKLHLKVIYKNVLYEAITSKVTYTSNSYATTSYLQNHTRVSLQKLLSSSSSPSEEVNEPKFEEVKMLGNVDEYAEEQFKNLKTGAIEFSNSPTRITASDVLVDMYAYVEDPILQKRIEDGTYFIVSSLNDADKLTMLTSPVTTQTATKNGDVIYACLTDGKGTYVATATETIGNIDKNQYTITYNLDGGTITGQKTTYNADDSFTLPTPTKEGYVFLGWTGSNGTTAQTSVTISKGSTGNKEYTANWDLPLSGSSLGRSQAHKISVNGLKYADLDGDGTADGIIVADLTVDPKTYGGGNPWLDSRGSFSYTKVTSGLKEYSENTSYKYKNADGSTVDGTLVKCTNNAGTPRYYIMSLADYDGNDHYWYKNAYRDMSDYSTFTSEDFGKGKENTVKMIDRMKNHSDTSQYSVDYGEATTGTYADVWNIIEDKVKEGWFVPSKAEWAAFASYLNTSKTSTDSNYYVNYGLVSGSWSSSQSRDDSAWYVDFGTVGMNGMYVKFTSNLRLCATF